MVMCVKHFKVFVLFYRKVKILIFFKLLKLQTDSIKSATLKCYSNQLNKIGRIMAVKSVEGKKKNKGNLSNRKPIMKWGGRCNHKEKLGKVQHDKKNDP